MKVEKKTRKTVSSV